MASSSQYIETNKEERKTNDTIEAYIARSIDSGNSRSHAEDVENQDPS